MRKVLAPIVAAAALFGAAACSSSDNSAQIVDDATVSQDVAASAGDAASAMINETSTSESTIGLESVVAPQGVNYSVFRPSFTQSYSRTRTCYDATHTLVANCTPLSSVRTIITQITHSRSRSGSNSVTGGATVSWSGSLNRSAYDSLTRVFTGATETSRVHNDIASEHDTSTFSNATVTRQETEVAHDSVAGLTYVLPRDSTSRPSAGTITRIDSVDVVATKSGTTVEKKYVRLVTITFPADANGNVTVTVTGGVTKTCTYNLGTGNTTCP